MSAASYYAWNMVSTIIIVGSTNGHLLLFSSFLYNACLIKTGAFVFASFRFMYDMVKNQKFSLTYVRGFFSTLPACTPGGAKIFN